MRPLDGVSLGRCVPYGTVEAGGRCLGKWANVLDSVHVSGYVSEALVSLWVARWATGKTQVSVKKLLWLSTACMHPGSQHIGQGRFFQWTHCPRDA
jgi:hypothetical protein